MSWMLWLSISLVGVGALMIFIVAWEKNRIAQESRDPYEWLTEKPVDKWWTRQGKRSDLEDLVEWDEAHDDSVVRVIGETHQKPLGWD